MLYRIIVFLLIVALKAHTQKPNIIFILADDLGYSDLGCYGNPFNQTPHIDKLANGGIKFNQAYAASPVCSPSRAAILTGKHPARLKLTNFLVGNKSDSSSPVLPAKWQPYLASKETTIAELLQKQGYNTGMVGKWHLGYNDTLMPYNQGFKYNRMLSKNGLDYYNYSIVKDNHATVFEDSGKTYLTDKITSYGVEFIKKQKSTPFFLYMAYTAPHVLLVPRADKVRNYLFKYLSYNEKYNPYYAAMIESLDDGVGTLIKTLDEEGLLENTIIIFTSDNGGVGLPEAGPTPTSCLPLRKWKGHLYEGGIRVPAIIYWKGKIPENKISNEYYSNVDYFSTLVELAGISSVSLTQDGKSIMSHILNPELKIDRGYLYWHYPHFSNQQGRPAGAIRNGDFKLVENLETNALELYNLKEDISEKLDLSSKMPQKVKEMYNDLIKWRIEVQANMPIPNPRIKK